MDITPNTPDDAKMEVPELDADKNYLVSIPLGAEVQLGAFLFTVGRVKGKQIMLVAGKNVTLKKAKEFHVEIT